MKLEQKQNISRGPDGQAIVKMYCKYFQPDGKVITLITTKNGSDECQHTLFSPQPNGKLFRRTGDFQSICLLTDPMGTPMPLDMIELNLLLMVEKSFRETRERSA